MRLRTVISPKYRLVFVHVTSSFKWILSVTYVYDADLKREYQICILDELEYGSWLSACVAGILEWVTFDRGIIEFTIRRSKMLEESP